MDAPYLIGLYVGISFALIFFMILYIFKKKKRINQYDERQKAIQGVAYKVGFFTMFAYFLINGFVCTEIGNWLPVFHMNFIGIGFGVICYAGYAIFNDAYISINSQPFRYLLSSSSLAVTNYLCYFINISKEKFNDTYLANLICAVLLTVIFVMLIIKIIIDKVSAGRERVD